MGLWGKGNRETQQAILDARAQTEKSGKKVRRSWSNALSGKKPKE